MITGVVLARNEERNIVPCLECLRPHVAELLLIDMESQDRTVALAQQLVDRVLDHPLVANFDAARNIAIPEASFDWLWFVDADERIPARTGAMVNQLLRERGSEFDAVTIPFKSYFCGHWVRGCGWWPGYTMPRVLKRGCFRFVERLHGGVECDGRQVRLPPDPELAIDHFSYKSVEHYIEKVNRYTSTEARQLGEQGLCHHWQRALSHMMHELWLCYERNDGRLDGEHGWILSWLSGQYRWLSHAKLIDQPGGNIGSNGNSQPPVCLDEVIELLDDTLRNCRSPHPTLPLGIVWRGPVWDPSGYADETRTFAKSLAVSERRIVLEDIHWADTVCDLRVSDRTLLQLLLRAKRPKYTATITDCIPTLVSRSTATSLNILRTTFETDRIPGEWRERLAQYDEVWVTSQHCYRAFVRSWIPPEKLRVVPSCVDTELFSPKGERFPIPTPLPDRFVFLSVFDWGLRKGWDVLLKAYANEFSLDEHVGLLLKISRNHGHSWDTVCSQTNAVLEQCGQRLSDRPDIVLWDKTLTSTELAALYRSADAFVLASRGEGWGRPYMEAMASGLPAIGSRATGNLDFMDDTCTFLVPGRDEDVPEAGWREISPYRGHRWFEPDVEELSRILREVYTKQRKRRRIAKRGCENIQKHFNLEQGRHWIETALAAAEQRCVSPVLSSPKSSQVRVCLEGEIYAHHSFAKINEQLIRHLGQSDSIALSVRRLVLNPTFDDSSAAGKQALAHVDRDLGGPVQITIRHSFPPNWEPVRTGVWIHIQPWEYGHLPSEWVVPLQEVVDEIWIPSNYVRKVYEQSGIAREKIKVIPWGIDESVYRPDAIPLLLPCSGSFRFLFVGGAIERKGFDRLLDAYISEFSDADDVCLVIKDIGMDSFYRGSNARERIQSIVKNSVSPEILYIEDRLTECQLSGLYAACHCLVAPYRGEGFGLPILEAMACGVVPIVPRGGASDDFVTEATAILLPSREVATSHVWQLCGPALEIDVSLDDIRLAMRRAYDQREHVRETGQLAAQYVREKYTWERTAARMIDRIRQLAPHSTGDAELVRAQVEMPNVAALIALDCGAAQIADHLARVRPYVNELVAVFIADDDRAESIVQEYGAAAYRVMDRSLIRRTWRTAIRNIKSEWMWVLDSSCTWNDDRIDMDCVRHTLSTVSDDVMAVVALDPSKPIQREGTVCLVRKCWHELSNLNPLTAINQLAEYEDRQVKRITINRNGHKSGNREPIAGVATPNQAQTGLHRLAVEEWLQPWVPQRGRVAIDVGANIGIWTRWLALSFERVHAIEPNPDAFPRLKAEVPDNVTIHQVAAWSHATALSFSRFAQSVHLSAYFQDEGIHTGRRIGQVQLSAVPIDSLDIGGQVDFIKCDTEGAEVQCLQGAEQTIRMHRPWLLVEIHSIHNFDAVINVLTQWGYLYSIIRDPNYEPFSELWYAHCWLSCQAKTS